MTAMGVILGTAAYMAPEQARGKVVDQRADIWAFGVVLFEMLTGRRTFAGDEISDTLASVLKTDPNWETLPSGTPPGMRRLLQWCLRKNPKERLQAIGDARLALADVGGTLEPRPSLVPVGSRGGRAVPWIAASALLIGLAVVSWIHFREPAPAA